MSPKVVESTDLLGLKILDMTPNPKQNLLSNNEKLDSSQFPNQTISTA
jgi:hypothetical protein